MIFLGLVGILCIALFLYHSKGPRAGSDGTLPPGIPFIRGLYVLFSKNAETVILNIGKKLGPVTRMNLGLQQLVFVNGASAIKEAGRSASLSGAPDVLFLRIMKERGMATPDDGKELRKFYMKNVKDFNFYGKTAEDTIHVEVSDFLDRVKAHGSRVFDVKRTFNIHTVNSMFGILFGVRMEQEDQEFQELLRGIEIYMDFPSTVGRLCFIVPRLADWVPSFLSGKTFVEQLATRFTSVVERHLEMYLQSRVPEQPRNYTDAFMDKVDVTTDETSVFHSSRTKSIKPKTISGWLEILAFHFLDLDALNNEFERISANISGHFRNVSIFLNIYGAVFNWKMLITEKSWVPFFIDVLLAAVETSSATLEWAVLFLSQFPDVQKRVHAEIDEVIGNERCPTVSDRDKMPYFQAVIEEVFRLAPGLPFGYHKCLKDTKLMGYDIPQDFLIFLNFHGINMDPDIWEDPEKFNPERFLDENRKFVKSEQLFTFGSGRRSCLGELLVRVKIFIFLTRILQSYNILPEKKLDSLRGETVLGYHCIECKVIFEPRKRTNQ